MDKQAKKIAISGIEGSFSEEAALTFASKNNIEPHILYATTSDECFKEVLSGKADLGVIALENSNGGIVYETVYAMAKYTFNIINIFEIDVRHNLMIAKEAKAEDINKITSHQQAIAQCKLYLKRKWPNATVEEYADTALAAKDLSLGNLPNKTAVIASRRAAELFELKILEENIQDLKFNFTSFLVISA